MSVDRSVERLLRWYPAGWRARYGEELAELIVDMSDGQRLPWRLRADVAAAGTRERLRVPRIGDPRSGGRLVLWAWAIFMLAGLLVAKTSEHWRSALPPGSHPVASAAFVALTVLASATAVLVFAGIALTLPSLVAFLRSGGWPQIRRWILAAASLTAAVVAATAGLAAWAHGLSPHARNGHDGIYGAAFLTWAALADRHIFGSGLRESEEARTSSRHGLDDAASMPAALAAVHDPNRRQRPVPAAGELARAACRPVLQ